MMAQREVVPQGGLPIIRATGWNTALKRLPRVEVRTHRLRGDLPRTVKLQFAPLQIKVRKFTFRYMASELSSPPPRPTQCRARCQPRSRLQRAVVTDPYPTAFGHHQAG